MEISSIFSIIFLTATLLLIVVSTIYLLKLGKLLKSLREHFPEEWSRLGSPTLVMNNSISSSWSVMTWIFHAGYAGLNDTRIAIEGDKCRGLLIVGLAALVVASISLMIVFSI